MKSSQNYPRPAAILLAALVGAFTITCTARATETDLTADMTQTTFNLAAGGNGVAITPPTDVPVFIAGVCNTVGDRGAGHVTMNHHVGTLGWMGINSPSAGNLVSGSSTIGGSTIVKIDFGGSVVIQSANADSFQVHNGTGAQATGSVKMIW